MSDSVDRDMDWFPWRRRRNSKEFIPPDMSGDSSSGTEEELKRLRRENEELRRRIEGLRSKMIAEILEPMKEFARLFEKEKPLIEECLRELSVMAQTLLGRNRTERAAIRNGFAVAAAGCAGVILAPVTLGLAPLLVFGGAAVGGAVAELAGIAMSASSGINEKRLLEILNISQNEITALGSSADEVCQAILKWEGNFYAEMAALGTASFDVTEAIRVLTTLRVNCYYYDTIKKLIELNKKHKNGRATQICKWVENGESDLAKLAETYSHVKGCISLIRDL